MPQSPVIDPPLRKPISEQHSANHRDGYFVELVDRNDSAFQNAFPLRRGMPYSTWVGAKQEIIDQFSSRGGLYFVKSLTPLGGAEVRSMPGALFVILYWACDTLADSTINAKISYFNESVSYPIYAIEYTVRRETYETTPTIANGTALTALLAIKVTAAGSGYVNGDAVNISGGLGAAAEMVVDSSGGISAIIVVTEGAGYDSASLPTISFTTSTGSGATAVAIVAPKTATLIHQDKSELPPDDNYANEWVKVTRIYRNPTGPALSGQELDQELNVAIPFTEQEVAAGLNIGDVLTEVSLIDTVRQKKKLYNASAITTAFNAVRFVMTGTVNMELPDVLTSVKAITSKGEVNGSYSETATGSGNGDTFYLTHSANGNAQGAASLTPAIAPEITQYDGRNIPAKICFFLLPFPVTDAAIKTVVDSMLSGSTSVWPKFIRKAHTIYAKGGKISAEARAKSAAQVSSSGTNFSTSGTVGSGISKDVQTATVVTRIPPTIHALITLDVSDFSTSAGFSVQVVANGAISILGGTVGANVDTGVLSYTVPASVSPSTLAATAVTAVPSSGLYIYKPVVTPYRLGWAKCAVPVVDAANVS